MVTSNGVDSSIPDPNPQPSPDLIPEVDSALQKPVDTADVKFVRPRKSPKPLVEGINSPVPGSDPAATMEPAKAQSTVIPPKVILTNSEKKLIEDPASNPAPVILKTSKFPGLPSQKIVLPSQGKKNNWTRAGWSFLISFLAVGVVLAILLWYNNKTPGGNNGFMGLFPKSPVEDNSGDLQNSQSSSTVPSNGNSSTSSSSVPVLGPVPTSTSTPILPEDILKLKVTATPTSYLNVRNGPSLSNKILTKVHPGETYQYTEISGDWYHIILNDGSTGWVNAKYITKIQN